MEALTRLADLIEKSVVPQLESLVNDVKTLTDETHRMRLSQTKHQGKIEGLEEKVRSLRCEDNVSILQGHGARIAKLEAKAEEGHNQDQECREKNKQVDEALRLAKKNKKKNEEQEARYNAALKWIWRIIAGILVLIGFAYYQENILKKDEPNKRVRYNLENNRAYPNPSDVRPRVDETSP